MMMVAAQSNNMLEVTEDMKELRDSEGTRTEKLAMLSAIAAKDTTGHLAQRIKHSGLKAHTDLAVSHPGP